jgi:hypothetical protein
MKIHAFCGVVTVAVLLTDRSTGLVRVKHSKKERSYLFVCLFVCLFVFLFVQLGTECYGDTILWKVCSCLPVDTVSHLRRPASSDCCENLSCCGSAVCTACLRSLSPPSERVNVPMVERVRCRMFGNVCVFVSQIKNSFSLSLRWYIYPFLF